MRGLYTIFIKVNYKSIIVYGRFSIMVYVFDMYETAVVNNLHSTWYFSECLHSTTQWAQLLAWSRK